MFCSYFFKTFDTAETGNKYPLRKFLRGSMFYGFCRLCHSGCIGQFMFLLVTCLLFQWYLEKWLCGNIIELIINPTLFVFQ